MIPMHVAERAATRYVVDPSGCHISTYSTGSHGYAQVGWTADGFTQMTTAHRAAWVRAKGQIPEGMTVDHTCKQRRCVRIDHLRILSNYDNARRTRGRDWPLGQCINGHPDSELRQEPSGRIRCQPCKKAAQARYVAKKQHRSTGEAA